MITSKKQLEEALKVASLWHFPSKTGQRQWEIHFNKPKKRFRSLLFSLERQPKFYKSYTEFVGAFVHLGHMEKVPTSELIKPFENCYCLCHNCVFKESSTTTKMRVVFNRSAKTTSGVSLNDRLTVGPKIQKDIFSILVQFWLQEVALSVDLAKMYRQVELNKEDK